MSLERLFFFPQRICYLLLVAVLLETYIYLQKMQTSSLQALYTETVPTMIES